MLLTGKTERWISQIFKQCWQNFEMFKETRNFFSTMFNKFHIYIFKVSKLGKGGALKSNLVIFKETRNFLSAMFNKFSIFNLRRKREKRDPIHNVLENTLQGRRKEQKSNCKQPVWACSCENFRHTIQSSTKYFQRKRNTGCEHERTKCTFETTYRYHRWFQ